MMVLNELSRWQVAAEAVRCGALHNPEVKNVEEKVLKDLADMIEQHKDYMLKNAKGL